MKTKQDAPPNPARAPAEKRGGADPCPGRAEPPRVVDWTQITLTTRCNQRCFFCYEDERDTATEPPFERVKELLRATRQQAEQVVFCGREVLMRKDIVDIVGLASAMGLRPVVFTNGQALARPGLVDQLAEAGCSGIAVSFHFPDAETFARGARVKAAGFSRTLEGLRRLRDHNLACPDHAIGLSTETDMFALNAGRLAGMRASLQEALDPSPWSMRLACLLPSRVHDIGLDPVLDDLDRRLDELAEFIATHPPELPLGFVKLPLCLLPSEELHRCLDVQYVHEGSRLTFNHLDGELIEQDPFSASVDRNIERLIRTHPYRWLCRGCELVPMCRFERVHWELPGFAPSREQRPTPFRAADITRSWWDRVALPTRTGTAAEVLSRLGPKQEAEDWAAAVHRALERRVFPEEKIFAQLATAGAGEPQLVDLYAEQEPVAVVVLEHGGEQVRLHLGVLGPEQDGHRLGAVVGYLDVGDLTPEATPEVKRRCLQHLGRLELPELSAWATDPWFDAPRARLVRAVWRLLGEGAWPGLGGVGSWRTRGAVVQNERCLVLEMAHTSGHDVALHCTLDEPQPGTSADSTPGLQLEFVLVEADRAGDPGALEELQRKLGGAVLVTPPQPDPAHRVDERVEPLPAISSLRLVVQRSGALPYCFHVARFVEGQPRLKRQGDLILWYTHQGLDGGAMAWARVLLAVMRHLQRPPAASTLSRWREVIGRAADRAGLGAEEWKVQWLRGADEAAEQQVDR